LGGFVVKHLGEDDVLNFEAWANLYEADEQLALGLGVVRSEQRMKHFHTKALE